MNTDHQREEELFEAARKMPDESARTHFLDDECAGNAALRRRLEGLLEAAVEAEAFFTESESALTFSGAPLGPILSTGTGNGNAARTAGIPGEETIGSRIGRYKLLQKLGEGGCGVVYLAEQKEPVRRRVALKIIKLGMDTRSVIARFEAERQALAMMDHPNIAHVFDAGATETRTAVFRHGAGPRAHGSRSTATSTTSTCGSGSICSCRSATPSSTPTRRASSIATSSPRTSS